MAEYALRKRSVVLSATNEKLATIYFYEGSAATLVKYLNDHAHEKFFISDDEQEKDDDSPLWLGVYVIRDGQHVHIATLDSHDDADRILKHLNRNHKD